MLKMEVADDDGSSADPCCRPVLLSHFFPFLPWRRLAGWASQKVKIMMINDSKHF